MKKSITTPRRLYLLSLGMLTSAVLLYGMVYGMLAAEFKRASAISKERMSSEQTDQIRSGLKQALAVSSRDRELINAYMVTENGVVDFIESLEKMGTDSSVAVQVNSLSDSFPDMVKENQIHTGKLILTLNISGSFEAVYRYVKLLEQIPQRLAIHNLSLEATGGSNVSLTRQDRGVSQQPVWKLAVQAEVVHYQK